MKKTALFPLHGSSRKRASERGVILLLACFSMPVMIGMLGLGIDLSVMYSIKAKLQMACDGAAVASVRALSLAQDTASQRVMAQSIATQWFRANFNDEYLGASVTSAPTVTVTDQASLRTIAVSATTSAPTYFMKYFGRGATPVAAVGEASRRDVAIMMVLDRSGSMNSSNNSYQGLLPCQVMVQAAKQFTGMFQPGRDRIGLTTFGETVQVVQSPTTNFQSVLGYANTAGNTPGALDNITCGSFTNTSSAISVSWNELYKLQLPGALNILVVFTDGTPTAGTFNFAGNILASGGCVNPANWVAYRQANSGGSLNLGFNSFYPSLRGMIGSLFGDGVNFAGVGTFYSPAGAAPVEMLYTASDAPGCRFAVNQDPNPSADIAYVPSQDVWGNASTGYRPVPGGNIALNGANIGNVVFNLADNAANFARLGHVYANGSVMPGTLINTIGLGGNGGVDFTLLQRMANDPHGDAAVPYPDYPGYIPTQPMGQFLYAADAGQLSNAFVKLASQILRISR